MQQFYAAHECANNEIAIFNSKEERDKWVSHKDWFSESVKDDEIFMDEKRTALTAKEAYDLIGNRLHNTKEYIEDNILDNVMWAFAAPAKIGGGR